MRNKTRYCEAVISMDAFPGKVVAVIRRKDDVEEKWVACPEDMTFTREEIMEQVKFQEQYFESEIVLDTEEGGDTT